MLVALAVVGLLLPPAHAACGEIGDGDAACAHTDSVSLLQVRAAREPSRLATKTAPAPRAGDQSEPARLVMLPGSRGTSDCNGRPCADSILSLARGPMADVVFPLPLRWREQVNPYWHRDVFGDYNATGQLPHTHLFHESNTKERWFALMSLVVLLLAIDIFVLRRFTAGAGFGTHLCLLVFWLLVACGCAGAVFTQYGEDLGWQWCSGYVLEWLLSMDNLFVFHIIFKAFVTPQNLLHKALFWGILGAVLFRMVFFVLLHNLLELHWVFKWCFGLILIYSGVQAARDDGDEEDDPTASLPVRMLRRVLGERLCEEYDEPTGRLLVKRNDKWTLTLMVPVIVCLEVTDIVFAIDSVSAKTAQIPDQYMNYSSTVIAMFGLRAMFFIINDIMHYFEFMKYGLCGILIFIGLELIFSQAVALPAIDMCIILLSVFAVSIIASSVKAYMWPDNVSDKSSDSISSTKSSKSPRAAWK